MTTWKIENTGHTGACLYCPSPGPFKLSGATMVDLPFGARAEVIDTLEPLCREHADRE